MQIRSSVIVFLILPMLFASLTYKILSITSWFCDTVAEAKLIFQSSCVNIICLSLDIHFIIIYFKHLFCTVKFQSTIKLLFRTEPKEQYVE